MLVLKVFKGDVDAQKLIASALVTMDMLLDKKVNGKELKFPHT